MSCIHKFVPTDLHVDYEECVLCGTFHSRKALDPKKLYLSEYWNPKKWGHSSLEDQQHNVDVHKEAGKTKCEFVLERIDTYEEEESTVLELGCAPGNLLRHLHEEFRIVIGIEADRALELDIRRIGDHDGMLIFGLFPEVGEELPSRSVDTIIGLDIFEHAPDPAAFLKECHRLLKTGGQLFLMTPLVVPGIPFNPRFFHPAEHVWIHSQQHLSALLKDAGFRFFDFDRWTAGHETISAYKK